MSVQLRRMRWWDVPEAVAIEADVLAYDPWTAEQFWSELAGAGKWYVVAADGDEVVGFVGLAMAGGDADVQTLAVRRDRHGTGVGARLLAALLDEAARRRCTRVFLEVRADNDAAMVLYERNGFERIDIRRGYYADGSDAIVMRAALTPAMDAVPR